MTWSGPQLTRSGMGLDGLTANSLGRCRRGRHFVAFSGSQFDPGDNGGYGTPDSTINTFPTGRATWVDDGVSKTAYDALHGCERALFADLDAAGKLDGTVYLARTGTSVSTPDQVATDFATVAADVVSAGITPCLAFYIVAGQDQLNANAANGDLYMAVLQLAGLVYATWPGCGFAVFHSPTTDTGTYPFAAVANATAREAMEGLRNGRAAFIRPPAPAMQSDGAHMASAGLDAYGRAMALAILNAGIPG